MLSVTASHDCALAWLEYPGFCRIQDVETVAIIKQSKGVLPSLGVRGFTFFSGL